MSNKLFDGRRIRLLTMVDNHARESLAIHIGQRIRGREAVDVLERVMKDHGRARTIRVDDGSDSIPKDVDESRHMGRIPVRRAGQFGSECVIMTKGDPT